MREGENAGHLESGCYKAMCLGENRGMNERGQPVFKPILSVFAYSYETRTMKLYPLQTANELCKVSLRPVLRADEQEAISLGQWFVICALQQPTTQSASS